MKNIIKILLLAALAPVIASCSGDDGTSADIIEVFSADNEFTAAPGEGVIGFSASGDNVKPTSNVEWLTFKKITSTSVGFAVSENKSISNRAAVVTLKQGGAKAEITVYQQGAILSIPTVVRMPLNKATTVVKYNSTLDIIPTVINDDSDWFNATTNDNGEIIIETFSDNIVERTGTVRVRTDWSTITITVIQEGFLDKSSVYLFNGSLFAEDAIALNPEIVADLDITGTEDWYHAELTDSSLKIRAKTENTGTEPRVSYLTLKYGNISTPITVAQSNSTYYDFLRGEWEMSYLNDLRKKNVTIRFGSGENAGKLGLVVVIAKYPTKEFGTVLKFDETTGILSLTPSQIGSFGDTGNLIYMTLYSASTNYISKRDDISVDFVFNRDYNDPRLIFTDNGSWNSRIADGLLVAGYSPQLEFIDYIEAYPFIKSFLKK